LNLVRISDQLGQQQLTQGIREAAADMDVAVVGDEEEIKMEVA
jgi:hypothetical protein